MAGRGQTIRRIVWWQVITVVHGDPQYHRHHKCIAGLSGLGWGSGEGLGYGPMVSSPTWWNRARAVSQQISVRPWHHSGSLTLKLWRRPMCRSGRFLYVLYVQSVFIWTNEQFNLNEDQHFKIHLFWPFRTGVDIVWV